MQLPEYLSTDVWDAFEDSRKKQRAPLTDFARKRVLKKLDDIHRSGYVADEVLAEAVERGWRSVFITNDSPRRESNHQEREVLSKINGMASKTLKVVI
jgi:rRNA-processing protein FCF1